MYISILYLLARPTPFYYHSSFPCAIGTWFILEVFAPPSLKYGSAACAGGGSGRLRVMWSSGWQLGCSRSRKMEKMLKFIHLDSVYGTRRRGQLASASKHYLLDLTEWDCLSAFGRFPFPRLVPDWPACDMHCFSWCWLQNLIEIKWPLFIYLFIQMNIPWTTKM